MATRNQDKNENTNEERQPHEMDSLCPHTIEIANRTVWLHQSVALHNTATVSRFIDSQLRKHITSSMYKEIFTVGQDYTINLQQALADESRTSARSYNHALNNHTWLPGSLFHQHLSVPKRPKTKTSLLLFLCGATIWSGGVRDSSTGFPRRRRICHKHASRGKGTGYSQNPKCTDTSGKWLRHQSQTLIEARE